MRGNLEEEEIEALEKNSPYELQPGLPLKHSVIVDISGGGLRFLSSQKYEPGSLILCSYHLLKDGERKKYDVVGKGFGSQGTGETGGECLNTESSTTIWT